MLSRTLGRNTNQARGLAEFALEFLQSAKPAPEVLRRLKLFHTDSVLCGISALAQGANAPRLLRREALEYQMRDGAKCFCSHVTVKPEKAVLANCSAVREWDMNGTVLGYNPTHSTRRAGEFGHNDFYSVAMAAAQIKHLSGHEAVLGMLLVDEIRGRLAEVFSLNAVKVDHVLHGAIASACTYGAMVGASPLQIERAIGLVIAHYVPFRAIRAGKQLSDSKGASASFSAETAVLSVQRCMNGFLGPEDIFRNPEAIFRLGVPTDNGDSPFDLELSLGGSDFAVMNMHFKLGLYEHQSASAILGILQALESNPELAGNLDSLEINISTYKIAHHIIGSPDKRHPKTRQSADHSMVYIVSRLLRKAIALRESLDFSSVETLWQGLMLMPEDYSEEAIADPVTKTLMDKVEVHYGGKDYDAQYPLGLPTRVQVNTFDSGVLLFPPGHSRCKDYEWAAILKQKLNLLAESAVNNPKHFIEELDLIDELTPEEVQDVYTVSLKKR
jgi:2-methylcitrate dehydratase